jgi:hypothetical protein
VSSGDELSERANVGYCGFGSVFSERFTAYRRQTCDTSHATPVLLFTQTNAESWSTAHVSSSNFNTAQREYRVELIESMTARTINAPFRIAEDGFQANFAYISGANTKDVKIPMTGGSGDYDVVA